MNLDDFNVSKLKTKYQKLRFVLVVLSSVIFGLIESELYRFQFKFAEDFIDEWQPHLFYFNPRSDFFYSERPGSYFAWVLGGYLATIIGALVGAIISYYSFKVWEWINKEDKL